MKNCSTWVIILSNLHLPRQLVRLLIGMILQRSYVRMCVQTKMRKFNNRFFFLQNPKDATKLAIDPTPLVKNPTKIAQIPKKLAKISQNSENISVCVGGGFPHTLSLYSPLATPLSMTSLFFTMGNLLFSELRHSTKMLKTT